MKAVNLLKLAHDRTYSFYRIENRVHNSSYDALCMTQRRKTGCRMQERRAKDYTKKGRPLDDCGACLQTDFKTVGRLS